MTTDIPTDFPRYGAMQPFPLPCLPKPILEYVQAQSDALDCAPSAVVLPALSALASAVGCSRRIRLKPSWSEPAVLWTVTLANGHQAKGPPVEAAIEPVRSLDERALRLREKMMRDAHQKAAEEQERSLAPIRTSVKELPPVVRYMTTDWGIPSILGVLKNRPRGVLVSSEELDGWLGRPNPYGARRSLETSQWIDMHAGRSLSVTSRAGKTTHIPQSAVSVTGTMEAQALVDKLIKSKSPCPLTSRLLFSFPESGPRRWTTDDMTDEQITNYRSLFDRLLSLKPESLPSDDDDDVEGEPEVDPEKLKKKPLPVRAEGVGETPEEAGMWYDADRVLKLILKGPTYQGYDPSYWIPAGQEENIKKVNVRPPTYEDLLEAYKELCPKSRRHEEIFAFGGGWGQPELEDDEIDFIEMLDAYEEHHEPELKAKLEKTAPNAISYNNTPGMVDLTPEAQELFGRFMTTVASEQFNHDEALQAWFINLPSQTARLALILHLARWAAGEDVTPDLCDTESMDRAIEMAIWFLKEAVRVVALFSIAEEDKEAHRIFEWAFRRGGIVSDRDLSRSNGRTYPTSEAAHQALERLAQRGMGVWLDLPPSERGGRPCRVFSIGVGDSILSEEEDAEEESPVASGAVVSDKVSTEKVESGAVGSAPSESAAVLSDTLASIARNAREDKPTAKIQNSNVEIRNKSRNRKGK